MRLVKQEEKHMVEMSHNAQSNESYTPLFIIITLITIATAAVAIEDFESGKFIWQSLLTNFMAGFFLVFSGFKLLDVRGFAEGYSTYDLLASRLFLYGYIYPFIELAFGLAYLTSFHLRVVEILVFIVMGFSGLGVVRSMMKHQKIRCACLGTIIKVPLSSVTLVEDFGMALMALIVLLV